MTTTSETPNAVEEANPGLKDVGRYEFGWSDKTDAGATSQRGLSEGMISSAYFTSVILLIIVSSVLTPIVLKVLYNEKKTTVEAA